MNTEQKYTIPELLAPAGNAEKLATALVYGADAVYLGGQSFNLRASCDGLEQTELQAGVEAANRRGAKIYYTLNALPMQKDLAGLPALIEEAAEAGVHAFIVADPGVLRLARKYAPNMPVHLSTQANTTNSESVLYWADQGICRVNLARELSCRDIYSLRKAVPNTELEVFVHGAMCLAVSGQCLLSAWLNNRPANLGRCTHPCRFEYRALASSESGGCGTCQSQDAFVTVAEQTRPDEPLWTVHQDESYSSFWAPLDLCLVSYLPWFIRTGIDSLKVEGRMKGASYVAHVIDVYRTALDAAAAVVHGTAPGPFAPEGYIRELMNTASRPLGSGFFIPGMRKNFTEQLHMQGETASRPLLARFAESIDAVNGVWQIDVRGSWKASMPIEIMLPGLRRVRIAAGAYSLENHKGEKVDVVNSGMSARVYLERGDLSLEPGIFIRGAVE